MRYAYKSTGLLADIQMEKPRYEYPINWVGVEGVPCFFKVETKENSLYECQSLVDLGIGLGSFQRGIHMSRLVSLVNSFDETLTPASMKSLLEEMKNMEGSDCARVIFDFDYYKNKLSPISRLKSLLAYKCKISGILQDSVMAYQIEVNVPVMSVCPCSIAICESGGHSQRNNVKISILNAPAFIDEIIEVAEEESSTSVFSLLKRADEKYVIEKGFANPMFVEDIARNIVAGLFKKFGECLLEVAVISQESIHNHNAYAVIKNY